MFKDVALDKENTIKFWKLSAS